MLEVAGMDMFHPELQGVETLVQVRGHSADLPKPVVGEAGALTVVDFVIAEAGQFCPGRQPRLGGI